MVAAFTPLPFTPIPPPNGTNLAQAPTVRFVQANELNKKHKTRHAPNKTDGQSAQAVCWWAILFSRTQHNHTIFVERYSKLCYLVRLTQARLFSCHSTFNNTPKNSSCPKRRFCGIFVITFKTPKPTQRHKRTQQSYRHQPNKPTKPLSPYIFGKIGVK